MAQDPNIMKKQLLSMKADDITRSFVENNFGHYFDTTTSKQMDPKFNFTDKIILEANEYHNKEKIETTLGRLLANKFLYEDGLFDTIGGYQNTPFTSKQIKKTEELISNALLEGRNKPAQFKSYYDRIQWLGFSLHSFVCGSFTEKTVTPIPEVMKLKDALFKRYAKELAGPDGAKIALHIEEDLKEAAKKYLKDDPGMDLYNSGARASFDNNYKSMFIIRGPVYNALTQKYDILKNNFSEGMSKDDQASFGCQVIESAYPSAIGTKTAGYFGKKLFSVYSSTILDTHDSDCGSKMYRDVVITESNFKDVKYRWILDGTKLVCLDSKTAPKYYGKKVKMRSPMYCCSRKLCAKCAGDLFYRLGITNIGLTTPDISSAFLNTLLKAKHNLTTSLYTVKINEMFL